MSCVTWTSRSVSLNPDFLICAADDPEEQTKWPVGKFFISRKGTFSDLGARKTRAEFFLVLGGGA